MSPNLRLSQCATCTPRAAVRQFSIAAEALLNPRSPTSPSRFTPAPCRSLARKMSATPSVKRDTRAAIWAAAQAAAIRSRDADENSLFSCRELELPRPIWASSV